MRLIDADKLKESIERYRTVHLSHRRLSAIRREAEEVINDIRFAIDIASTIDPVKHGYWIYSTNYESSCEEYTCSLCGADSFAETYFCHHCGAEMEREEG